MAISASSYSVGNRVYRGGSSAPNIGTVDPTGYIDRELNNVASQTRSGIAQAALRRLGGGSTPLAGAQQSAPNAYGLDTQTQSGQAKGLATPGAGPAGYEVPKLSMSEIGKLQAPTISASVGGTDLPFDPSAADAQAQLLSRKNRFEQEVVRGQQDLEGQYTRQKQVIETSKPDEQRRLLENYAGRGLAYSSGYAHDVGSLESEFASLLGQLEEGKTSGIADLLRQRGMFSEDYANQLTSIQQAAARRAAARAGELNLNEQYNSQLQSQRDEYNRLIESVLGQRQQQPQQPIPQMGATEEDYYGGQAPLPQQPQQPPQPQQQLAPGMVSVMGKPTRFSEGPNEGPLSNAPTPQMDAPPPGSAPAPAPTPAVAPKPANARELNTFDSASQSLLQQGKAVIGGDGRVFKLVNGTVASTGMADGLYRDMGTFDATSQKKLNSGAEVTAGNGYVYRLNKSTGKVQRVR